MTTEGLHAPFRSRLSLLADDAVLRHVVGSADRQYARFSPDRQPWATIVVELCSGDLCRLDVAEAPLSGFLPHPDLGFVRVNSAFEDPALPGLAAVVAQLRDVTLVRYRPRNRCTLRGTTAGGGRYVKVGSVGQDQHDMQAAIFAAAEAGQIDVMVARPERFDLTTSSLWQHVVAGRPLLPDLLGPSGPEVAERMGAVLGQIAVSALAPVRRTDHSSAVDRSRRAGRRLTDRVPSLQARVTAVLSRLAEGHDRLVDRDLVPTHGSAHAHQWLSADGRLGLVDFDRHCMGEPEQDVATLIVELEFESGLSVPAADLQACVIAGLATAGTTVDPRRMLLYQAHKHLAKAVRTAWAIQPDGDVRAATRLRTAEELLAVA